MTHTKQYLGYSAALLLGALIAWAGVALAKPTSRPFGDFSGWKNQPKHAFKDGARHFKQIMELLKTKHLNRKLDEPTLYKAAIQGMLQLSDPKEARWNKLLSPTELAEMEASLHSRIAGIGIMMKFDAKSGMSDVLGIIPNSPAQRAKLRKGDRILKVDGVFYKGKNIRDVVYAIRGKIGTTVRLTILRDARIVTKTVTRGKVTFRPLQRWSLPGKIGFLKIHSFAYATPKLLKEALAVFTKEKAKGLIIDLRGNSGGALKSALKSADLLVPKGKRIASMRLRSGKERVFMAKVAHAAKLCNNRLYLLTGKRTSSGAELFAAALRAHCGARTIGGRTYGKWNVQKIARLSNGYAIRYSIGQFLDPHGKHYHHKGLAPDIPVGEASKKLDHLRSIQDIHTHLKRDSQLRVAHAMLQAR